MTVYGLSSTGFVAKPLTVIQDELKSAFKAAFGESINVSDQSGFGQLIGILAEREALLWEEAQAVYSAFIPDSATGAGLDGLAALTGTTREPASASEATITCTGTPATILPIGRVVETSDTGVAFESTEEKTIASLAAWVVLTVYAVGDRVTNAGKIYICITTGTSAGAGGPTTTAADITDGTVHWKHVGTGTGAVDVPFEAQETGPFAAVAGKLSVITTPVAGWQTAVNLTDATLGADLESDAALRLRREQELAAGANATLEAIRTAILDLDDVTACIVFENNTMVTDVDGIPAKSVEVLVLGGTDAEIREELFNRVAAGISTHGTESGTVEDSEGNDHTIEFSRPTEVPIYVTVEASKLPATFPADGSDQIKAALVAYGDLYPIGKNVVSSELAARVWTISGIVDVTAVKIGLAPTPTLETTLVITSRQLAVFDTARIVTTLSDGSL